MTVKNTINMGRVARHVTDVTEKGLQHGVEFLLTEANKHVPHDEGTLERSGRASVDGLTGAVSYDTPYAVMQHEDMTLSHQGKGESKWLENTMTREAEQVGAVIATHSRVG